MKYKVFAVRDKLRGFMQPLIDLNELSAKRDFSQGINKNPGMNFAPSDYDFYLIGEFDSDSGVITPKTPIEFICNGENVLNEK